MSDRPKWYMPAAVAAFLWNCMGCVAYLADVSLKPADIAKMTPDQQAMYAARPSWFVAAYAIAVWGGALGSLGLILRKRWATPFLLASVLGLLVQDAGLLSYMKGAVGAAVLGLQGAVLVIGVLLVLLARRASREGWLS